MSHWKIDSIHLHLLPKKRGNCDELRQYGEEEINAELMDNIIDQLRQGQVSRIDIDNEQIGMAVFVEGDLSHISVADEWNDLAYYFNNGSGSMDVVGIAGYEWMVCHQLDALIEIIKEFVATGKMLESPEWTWYKESTW